MPTLLSQAQHAIEWSQEIGQKTLVEGMFRDDAEAQDKAKAIVDFRSSRNVHRAHGRHLHRNELRTHGLNIIDLEADHELAGGRVRLRKRSSMRSVRPALRAGGKLRALGLVGSST
jgi:hypothetical protein